MIPENTVLKQDLVHLFIHPSCLLIYLFIHIFFYLSVCLFVYLSTCHWISHIKTHYTHTCKCSVNQELHFSDRFLWFWYYFLFFVCFFQYSVHTQIIFNSTLKISYHVLCFCPFSVLQGRQRHDKAHTSLSVQILVVMISSQQNKLMHATHCKLYLYASQNITLEFSETTTCSIVPCN